MNNAVGSTSSVFGGSINTATGTWSSVIGGSHNTALGLSSTAVGGENAIVDGTNSVGVAGGSTNADYALAAGNEATVTVNNGTAIGYQATANKEGTVAFGHDKGDVYYTSTWPQKATEKDGKYYDAKNKEITKDQYEALRNADLTFNDYSQKPTVTENKYGAAAYNRLVKVADGVDAHDVVVMEQLKNAKNDLKVNAGWGINVNDVTTKDGVTETTTKNVISLNRNLGTNYGNPWKGEGKVTFEAGGENSMILGGAASILFNNEKDDVKAGAYGKDSVLVGGFNNLIDTVANDVTQTGENAVIVGGDTNTVTGLRSVIVGGYQNKVSGGHSIVIGGASNEIDGGEAGVFGGQSNKAAGGYSSVLGGDHNEADGDWSSAIGGTTNTASGLYATTLGGINNDAKGNESVVVGGVQNVAIREDSTVNGGAQNTSYGSSSYAAGGMKNMAFGNVSVALGGQDSSVNGKLSTGIAGGSTGENAMLTLAAGYQSVVTDSGVEWRPITQDEADKINQGINSWPGYSGFTDWGDGSSDSKVKVLDRISTAVGYQSTADAPGVIAFGHDKGDVASVAKKWKQKATMEVDDNYSVKYYDANHREISADDYNKLVNSDGTLNDYTQDPIETETTYQSAYYNRLVKAADGIDAHDAVVMEQLKPYTKSDASNVGANLKTYTVGDDGETITETDATADQKKTNKDDWGKALGAEKFTTGTDTTATNASTSEQLVTGKTLYNYDAPVAETGKKLNYVSANNTTGQNLLNLDSQVKTNTDTLSDVNSRSVKYDTKKVNDKTVVDNTKITLAGEGGTTITNLKDGVNANDAATVGQMNTAIGNAKTKYYSVHEGPQIAGFSTNENNDGASAWAGLAAGYETGTAGIGSTVVGSYSGVMNTGTTSSVDLRGAASISLGTLNLNQNTDTSKTFSGVANSIVGQGNMTTNSNAAIILGAGNTITDSYKDVNIDTSTMKGSTPEALEEALQKAVPESGAQVMAIGGGNKITSAYKTQVVGLGNTVSDTELNYVEGFNNTVTGGTSNYIVGTQNTLTGGSKNIVFGDNHTLSNKSNNVVIGSADSSKELAASDAVVIGHNADVNVDGGVALGSDSVASVKEGQKGYDPAETVTNKTTAPWTSTKAAVSVGKADGSITRQITGVAAGTNDTDAVNVAQIKKLASVDASNIGKNFKDGDMTTNENAWGEALGTGTVTKDSKQLVTGDTVYNEVRPSKDGKYVKMSQTTGANLLKLDNQVKTNTDKLSDVDSRSVKYDTKKVNDKTVVDNTKITLDGEGGTTITNLKDGVNANDAATVGQLDARISGVTYKAGDGIKYDTDADNKKTISVNKGDGLKFTEDHKLAVNTGKHLSVNTSGQIDVGDNGTVAENDGNLVTGDTVYKALNGGMTKIIIGTPGKDGKDGKDGTPGTIGLVGPAGTNGKDGVVDITIQKGEDGKDGKDGTKGANGVDGKDGINRIVYEDKNGKHQVATMEDGLKFAGDDGQKDATKAIAKKLNNTVDIIGGADSTKLTANNIGVNNVDGKLKIQLAQELTGITSISGSTGSNGAKITLDTNDQNISVNGGKITDVASGLSTNDGSYNTKDANNTANISDVNSMISKAVTDAKGETQQDLDKKANVDASNIGTNLKGADGKTAATEAEQKANLDKWGEALGTGTVTKDNKQLVTGGTVYNEVRPSKDGKYVKMSQTTGANLLKLDNQVKTNTDKLSDVDSRSVKYDTKKVNDKTVVDNTKITLDGEGGTTITNLKDGVNANDAATVGQLDARISGVTYKAGDGIKYDTDADNKKTISVNKGDGLKFDEGKLAVDAGNGLKIDNGAVAIKTSDSNLKVDSNGIGLSDKITIGSEKTKQVTIDGTKGEISGLTNTTWDSKADYSKSTKAATESQVDAAVKDAVKQAGDNDVDTHVKAGSYGVDANHQVSMDIVDKNGKATGKKVTITDVATHTEVGDVTKLDKGVQNASGTTSVVDAINNVNTSMNTKIGDQKYSTSGSNKYVQDGDSITSAIGKLDGAVQQATTAAGQHSTVSAGSNITVTPAKQTDGHTDYQVALNKDITVDSVTAKTATTDTLTVNNSATIGGVTIANNTISGLDDTKIEKGSTNAVNAGTIYNELRLTNNGSYIQTTNTTAQNLVSLDTQVKKTSDLINSDGKTIKIGGSDAATKIDVSGNSTPRVITGVQTDPQDATSAANVGYVNDVTAASTQQVYRDMNRAYGSLNNNINRAAAGSNALAALHPLDFDPADKASFAFGYGHYRNANAGAFGAFYQLNANTMVNFGITVGNGDPGFNAGVSFKIGKGSAYNGVSKAEMAQTIHDQATEISAIKADDAAKDKRIDALEKENQEMKKQIQEILARLNG